jgi:carboxylesterase type B
MVLAGHSAGSQSIAYWSCAYKADPIVSGLIEFSGKPGLIANDDGSSWKSIANATGCSDADKETEWECMRSVPARSLKRAMSLNNFPSFTDSVISGGTPAVDNVTVFPLDEYTTRGITGGFAKLVNFHLLSMPESLIP